MTYTKQNPRLLTPMLDESTPDGVDMWLLQRNRVLPEDCPVSACRFVVEPGSATEMDVHEVVEMWTVTSGQGTVCSGDSRIPVSKGCSVLFDSWVDHKLVNESDVPVEVFSIWWSRGTR